MWPEIFITYTCFTIIPLIAELILKKYKNRNIAAVSDNSHYKCIFTTVTNAKCRQHILYDKAPCGISCSYLILQTLVSLITNAKESVSMCIYLLTCHDICSALINCHKEGKLVRVIVDKQMWGCSGSKGRILHKYGVPIKVQKKKLSMMHHKFCLIDENTPTAELFIGTVNMTLQGLCSNWDTFVYTDNKETISCLKTEFEELWSDFVAYDNVIA